MALLTDGRFSGVTYGLVVGHIAPGSGMVAQLPISHAGDMVTVDQDTKEISMAVSDQELAKRRQKRLFHRFIVTWV